MVDDNHYSKSSIKLRCDEIRKLCDNFQDALDAREDTLHTTVDVFRCLDQVIYILCTPSYPFRFLLLLFGVLSFLSLLVLECFASLTGQLTEVQNGSTSLI